MICGSEKLRGSYPGLAGKGGGGELQTCQPG